MIFVYLWSLQTSQGEGIASIAADTLRINGALRQFKQVRTRISPRFLGKGKCLFFRKSV